MYENQVIITVTCSKLLLSCCTVKKAKCLHARQQQKKKKKKKKKKKITNPICTTVFSVALCLAFMSPQLES